MADVATPSSYLSFTRRQNGDDPKHDGGHGDKPGQKKKLQGDKKKKPPKARSIDIDSDIWDVATSDFHHSLARRDNCDDREHLHDPGCPPKKKKLGTESEKKKKPPKVRSVDININTADVVTSPYVSLAGREICKNGFGQHDPTCTGPVGNPKNPNPPTKRKPPKVIEM